MIIVHILGGLGNQMFQYAAGRALADARGAELKLDLTGMADYEHRSFDLDQFSIRASIAAPQDIPVKPKKGIAGLLQRFTGPAPAVPRYAERSLRFDPAVLRLTDPVHLTGYWQCETYFSAFAEAIRADFSLVDPLTPERQGVIEQIKKASSPVSIHVRRGDYVTNAQFNAVHGTCEPDWYEAAVAKMVERLPDATFFLFSDDPEWARDNIRSSRPIAVVEPREDGRDAQDMHLMAACGSHIIANSSFSWWGAWLNPSPDKHVIAPQQWFRKNNERAKDIVPDGWERV